MIQCTEMMRTCLWQQDLQGTLRILNEVLFNIKNIRNFQRTKGDRGRNFLDESFLDLAIEPQTQTPAEGSCALISPEPANNARRYRQSRKF